MTDRWSSEVSQRFYGRGLRSLPREHYLRIARAKLVYNAVQPSYNVTHRQLSGHFLALPS